MFEAPVSWLTDSVRSDSQAISRGAIDRANRNIAAALISLQARGEDLCPRLAEPEWIEMGLLSPNINYWESKICESKTRVVFSDHGTKKLWPNLLEFLLRVLYGWHSFNKVKFNHLLLKKFPRTLLLALNLCKELFPGKSNSRLIF